MVVAGAGALIQTSLLFFWFLVMLPRMSMISFISFLRSRFDLCWQETRRVGAAIWLNGKVIPGLEMSIQDAALKSRGPASAQMEKLRHCTLKRCRKQYLQRQQQLQHSQQTGALTNRKRGACTRSGALTPRRLLAVQKHPVDEAAPWWILCFVSFSGNWGGSYSDSSWGCSFAAQACQNR